MKVRINISIDEEAVDILNQQSNKSQFIEDLIMARVPQTPTTGGLTKEEVLDLIKSEIGRVPSPQNSSTVFVPRPPDPTTGYPCCEKQAPCKHWIFNGAESHWKNELTGKIREVV